MYRNRGEAITAAAAAFIASSNVTPSARFVVTNDTYRRNVSVSTGLRKAVVKKFVRRASITLLSGPESFVGVSKNSLQIPTFFFVKSLL